MYGSRGRKRVEAHEKSMGSYELFAWRDAMSISQLVIEHLGFSRAKNIYSKVSVRDIMDFEQENNELIGQFIQKSESQRPSFFKKLTKEANETSKVLFLVLAIIGVIRAKNVMELRDNYRSVLAPGSGNRITTASIYDFSNEMFHLFSYDWPLEVFEATGNAYDDSDD